MKKESFKENLLEALLEILFYAVLFAIGAGFLFLIGKNPFDMDFDNVILIAFGVIAAICVAVYFLKKMFKRKKKVAPKSSCEKDTYEEN